MTILLSDPVVHAVALNECGEPLVHLEPSLGAGVLVRASLAKRLVAAAASLPAGLTLWVVEGHRSSAAQQAIIDAYAAAVRAVHPTAGVTELDRLISRFVSPMAVAPHVAGAAVDLTLRDNTGRPLDLGTPIDATPEQSEGACWFAAPHVSAVARHHRTLLATALTGAGLVNYPTEWWHWSFGDRYWALVTGAPYALYGPVALPVAA